MIIDDLGASKKFLKRRFKTIIWDFDGVIVDSLEVREEGFLVALDFLPKDLVNRFIKYHRANTGYSRYQKLDWFEKRVLKKPLSNDLRMKFYQKYNSYVLSKLCDKQFLIEGTEEIFKSLRLQQFIVSASDQSELRLITESLGLKEYFAEIKGSPIPKTENINNLLSFYNLDRSATVLIGDSINDFEAAEINGISFLGINNPNLIGIGTAYLSI